MSASITPESELLLEVRGLGTGYGDLRVVWDVSFDVRAGEITVLLGRNGAGKTTTIRAISGLNKIVAGEVRYRGESLAKVPAHQRVRRATIRGGIWGAVVGVAVVPYGLLQTGTDLLRLGGGPVIAGAGAVVGGALCAWVGAQMVQADDVTNTVQFSTSMQA